jgi:hypothetical protein
MKVWVLIYTNDAEGEEVQCDCGALRKVEVFPSYKAACNYAWDNKSTWWVILDREVTPSWENM